MAETEVLWTSFLRLPKFGTYRVLEELGVAIHASDAGSAADT